jgi:hypothetical protein
VRDLLNTSQKCINREKAKEFDEWVSRAHNARFNYINPSAGAKGSSLLKSRRETGLSLIAEFYKETVRKNRRETHRKKK